MVIVPMKLSQVPLNVAPGSESVNAFSNIAETSKSVPLTPTSTSATTTLAPVITSADAFLNIRSGSMSIWVWKVINADVTTMAITKDC